MENGPLIFLGVAGAIVLTTLIAAKLLKRSINKPMPGDDARHRETHWYGGDGHG